MNIEKIEASLNRIKKLKKQLNVINDEKELIELRVFTTNEWSNIDFQPKNKAIYSMVVHQIKMELKSEIKQEEINIKKATE